MDIVEYTEFLVKNLVKDPDSVKVDMFASDEDTKILEIIVSDREMKSVIGKDGRNANALRTLINAYSYIHNMPRVKINIDSY